ncbi:MAG: hypothetical protein EPO08_06075 [Rhodospirillaceae bacterium]|nr:MAG: hypothetical protein EPO08_06075 [Rhodospirillaceae bacterium]
MDEAEIALVQFTSKQRDINFVPARSLSDAARYGNTAMQPVGIYADERKAALREEFAFIGGQRAVGLGLACKPQIVCLTMQCTWSIPSPSG